MISLIIPAYNEEKNIGKLLDYIPNIVNEIIVVNDGSTDNTSEIVKRYSVNLVSHNTNLGKGAALLTGIKNSKGDILIFMDADLQHDPKDILKIIKPILKGDADFVNASRFLGNWKKMPFLRLIYNLLVKELIFLFVRRKITDPLSGFRVIKRGDILNMNLKSKGYEIEVNLIFEALKRNLKIIEVPIVTKYDTGVSTVTFLDAFKILRFILMECIKFKSNS